MPTERINIVVSEKGSRTVKRNIDDIATSVDRAGDEAAELRSRLKDISPTRELANTMRQMQTLKQIMGQTAASSKWPRQPIANANAELFTAIGRMTTLRANMRDQTPWAATKEFVKADAQLAGIQARLNHVHRLMAKGPQGPTSSLKQGPQAPAQYLPGFAGQLDHLNNVGRPAVGITNDIAKGVDSVGSAAKGAHKPTMLLGRYVGAFGSFMAARELMNFADSATVVKNRVNIVSDSVLEAEQGVRALYSIARDTRAPIEEMAGLYQKGMMASEELGVSQKDVLKFVEAVGMGLAIQGASANTARGALTQLSQAIGTDIVRAEEFNSILEGAYPIALAAAKGIDEAGGSVAKLRRMVIDGEVSSEQFFNAIMSQYPMIADMFHKTTPTIGQAFIILQNSLKDYIDTSKEAQIISGFVADSIILIADNIAPIADVLFAMGIAWSVGFAGKHIANVGKMATNTGLMATAAGGLKSVLGFMGGPIVGGLALLAGTAFFVMQNTDSAADKIERLSKAMDSGVGAIDAYNTAVQMAKDEQAELGGVINLTTEAMLRQSRSNLQDALGVLQQEIRALEQDVKGKKGGGGELNDAKAELAGFGKFQGFDNNLQPILEFDNKDLEQLYAYMDGVQKGTATIDELFVAVERLRGAGPEIAASAKDLAVALEALPSDLAEKPTDQAQLWLDQAEAQMTAIAEGIGGLDAEIEAAAQANSLPEKVEALEALQAGLDSAKFAGDLVRGSNWISDTADLLKALQDAKDLEQSMMEALGANASRLNELATEAEQFRKPVQGAADASADTNAALDQINFTPLQEGARGFADQLIRASQAAANLKGMQAPAANTNNAPTMASFSPGVTRDQMGTNGLTTLNSGGSFTVGGNGGIDQNLISFWASRGEQVSVTPRSQNQGGLMDADRTGQSKEYLEVIKQINQELETRFSNLQRNNTGMNEQQVLQDALQVAQREGTILAQEDISLIGEKAEALSAMEKQMELVGSTSDAIFGNMKSSLDNFIDTGKFSFSDFASSVIKDLAKIGVQMAVIAPLKNMFGSAMSSGGGIFNSVLEGLGLPGFNEGADFTVGGTGGVDKNVVAFKASRGERVQVTPAGESSDSKGNTVVNFNIQTPDVEGFRRSQSQIAAQMARVLASGKRNM